MTDQNKPTLRSQMWFDNPDNRKMTASYLERYLNYGMNRCLPNWLETVWEHGRSPPNDAEDAPRGSSG